MFNTKEYITLVYGTIGWFFASGIDELSHIGPVFKISISIALTTLIIIMKYTKNQTNKTIQQKAIA